MRFPLSFAMTHAGFTALCLSMHRHQCDVLGKPLTDRRTVALRIIGYGLLLAAYLPCLWQTAPCVAVVPRLGIASVAAILLVSILTLKARSILWWAPMLVVATVLLQDVGG